MNRPLACLSLLLAALPATVHADWVLGLRGGMSRADRGDADTTAALAARGHAVTARVDDRDLAVFAHAGYRFHPLLTMELGLGRLGDFETRVIGTSAAAATLPADLARVKAAGGELVSLTLRQDLPLHGPLSLVSRLGGFAWQQREEFSNGSRHTQKGSGVVLGAALQYRLPGPWALSLGTDGYRQNGGGTVYVVSGGVEYRFGP